MTVQGLTPIIKTRVDPNRDDDQWRMRGECRPSRGHDPEIWFPLNELDARQGVLICLHCPVIMQCRTEALENREGIGTWGGLTQWDRYRKHGFPRPRKT